jgi:flagellar protein FliS
LSYNNTRAGAVLSSYKETQIKTASQGQLIMMLYDEAVKQLNRALELLGLNDSVNKVHSRIEQINKSVMKAEEIITELIVSLDFDQGGEIAQNLFAVYTWFNKELLEANIAKDSKRLQTVRDMLLEIRKSWSEIISKNNVESVNREVVGLNIAG